jgi:glycosyltransferase involved in cell wall biosynthesis
LINAANFLKHPKLEEFVRGILQKTPSVVILSGGDQIEIGIAEVLRRLNPKIEIILLWHGSPANWSENHERNLFSKWVDAQRKGIVNRIDVVDEGLESFLCQNGIESKLIMNMPPRVDNKDKWEPRLELDLRQILLAAASNSFRKNYYNQIVAACMLGKPNEIKVLGLNELPSQIFGEFPINLTSHVSEKEFEIEIKKSRLVMYATLSECSPMVPLESIAIGTPVICGPTAPYLRNYQELRKLIVVKNPDSINCIVKTLEELLANTATYSTLAADFMISYSKESFDYNSNIYGDTSIREVLVK